MNSDSKVVNIEVDRGVWKRSKTAANERDMTLKEFVDAALKEALKKS